MPGLGMKGALFPSGDLERMRTFPVGAPPPLLWKGIKPRVAVALTGPVRAWAPPRRRQAEPRQGRGPQASARTVLGREGVGTA